MATDFLVDGRLLFNELIVNLIYRSIVKSKLVFSDILFNKNERTKTSYFLIIKIKI